jgi:hypothetical protein
MTAPKINRAERLQHLFAQNNTVLKTAPFAKIYRPAAGCYRIGFRLKGNRAGIIGKENLLTRCSCGADVLLDWV